MANNLLSEPPFDLAIVGGGIAGLVMSISLLKHKIPHTLYESASRFGEIGAGVGFEAHFVRIMELISPEIREAFMKCSEPADDENPVWIDVMVGDMAKADEEGRVLQNDKKTVHLGETFVEWPGRPGPRGGVHRAHFLDELVKLIPEDVPRFGKRLVDISSSEDDNHQPILHFSDGTTAKHSAVIGCDGIKSRTREILLGTEIAAKPVFSGKYAYRGLIPMAKAIEIMGSERPRKSCMFCGFHRHVLTFPIARGSILNVVAFNSREEWADNEWVVTTSRANMLADYASWTPEIQAIIGAMERTDIWALFDHPPASTYYSNKPRICLVGDAAHASTPFQGAGAGMCVEDCYILGEMLAETVREADLGKAFRAYDHVRRHRSQKLVTTSREGGMLYEFEGPEGDDLEAITRDILQRMRWIWDVDLSTDLEQALSILKGKDL